MDKKKYDVEVFVRREGEAYAHIAVEAGSAAEARAEVQRLIDDGTSAVWHTIYDRLDNEGCADEATAEEVEEVSEKYGHIDLDLSNDPASCP